MKFYFNNLKMQPKVIFYISALIIFILCKPSISNSQSIQFKITDCVVYLNNEIDLEKTRELREDCYDNNVVITFYPDTNIIELEIKVPSSGFNDKILKLDRSRSSNYQTQVDISDNKITIDLNLNKFLGYIRGGEIKLHGGNGKSELQEVIVEFESK